MKLTDLIFTVGTIFWYVGELEGTVCPPSTAIFRRNFLPNGEEFTINACRPCRGNITWQNIPTLIDVMTQLRAVQQDILNHHTDVIAVRCRPKEFTRRRSNSGGYTQRVYSMLTRIALNLYSVRRHTHSRINHALDDRIMDILCNIRMLSLDTDLHMSSFFATKSIRNRNSSDMVIHTCSVLKGSGHAIEKLVRTTKRHIKPICAT